MISAPLLCYDRSASKLEWSRAERCCAVPSCGHRGLGYAFPTDRVKREKWLKAIGRENDFSNPTSKDVVCSRHFSESDFTSIVAGQFKILKTDAVPTVFLDDYNISEDITVETTSRKRVSGSCVEWAVKVTFKDEVTDPVPVLGEPEFPVPENSAQDRWPLKRQIKPLNTTKCVVPGCIGGPEFFFPFHSTKVVKMDVIWARVIDDRDRRSGQVFFQHDCTYICRKHFERDMFDVYGYLLPEAVPTIFVDADGDVVHLEEHDPDFLLPLETHLVDQTDTVAASCADLGCPTKFDGRKKCFAFGSGPRAQAWARILNIRHPETNKLIVPTKHQFLCADHFSRDKFAYEDCSRLIPHAMPTRFSYFVYTLPLSVINSTKHEEQVTTEPSPSEPCFTTETATPLDIPVLSRGDTEPSFSARDRTLTTSISSTSSTSSSSSKTGTLSVILLPPSTSLSAIPSPSSASSSSSSTLSSSSSTLTASSLSSTLTASSLSSTLTASSPSTLSAISIPSSPSSSSSSTSSAISLPSSASSPSSTTTTTTPQDNHVDSKLSLTTKPFYYVEVIRKKKQQISRRVLNNINMLRKPRTTATTTSESSVETSSSFTSMAVYSTVPALPMQGTCVTTATTTKAILNLSTPMLIPFPQQKTTIIPASSVLSSAPSASRSVPSTSRSVPSTSRSVPSTSRSVRSTSRSVPSTSRSVPSTSRSVPSTSKSVPSTIPNLSTSSSSSLLAKVLILPATTSSSTTTRTLNNPTMVNASTSNITPSPMCLSQTTTTALEAILSDNNSKSNVSVGNEVSTVCDNIPAKRVRIIRLKKPTAAPSGQYRPIKPKVYSPQEVQVDKIVSARRRVCPDFPAPVISSDLPIAQDLIKEELFSDIE